jgi:low affinity Fe/Cu permease
LPDLIGAVCDAWVYNSDMKDKFRIFAGRVSVWAGSATVFIGALLIIIIWALSGPILNFSDRWQLFINSVTTIVTFLMVFLIQNTQNRDGRAMQLKLDELILTNKGARESFVDLEDISDEELEVLTNEFRNLHEHVNPSQAMHKLHQKIEQEHAKRQSHKKLAKH